jgi:hypothetical protein
MEIGCYLGIPIFEEYISSFGIPKVDDVIFTQTLRSIRPSNDLRDLWGFRGVIMKVLEVPKCPLIQGVIRSDGPDEASNTIY